MKKILREAEGGILEGITLWERIIKEGSFLIFQTITKKPYRILVSYIVKIKGKER